MYRRRTGRVGALVTASVTAFVYYTTACLGAEVREPAPPFELPNTEGNQVALEDYRGKPAAIVFCVGFF